ncbi:MAG: glycosyltransferase family 10 domain-containing protein [Kiritimatiellia bacterium]
MKKRIKVAFVGFSSNCRLEDRFVYRVLARRFEVVPTADDPDYLIDHGVMSDCLRYDRAVRILLSGENTAPDFNAYDYALGHDHIQFGDRYLRSPLFVHWGCFPDLVRRAETRSDSELLDRRFCSFVVSNASFADPIRERFFRRLSQYRQVDSGGRFLNNVGGPVKDKLAFCRGYKFNLAFENSAHPGYTTEKIVEAYAAESVPIYFGNPTVETDFRPESMVRVRGEDDIERAVEEIVRLDRDDAAYLAKCRERCFAVSDPTVYERELEAFLVHIFDQPLERARRRARYGYQAMMRAHVRKLATLDRWVGKVRKVLHV